MSSYVYRYYDIHGELLYIGLADNPEQRLAQHRAEKGWADQIARWDTTEYSTRSEAAAAERTAILADQPKYNVVHGPALQLERKPGSDRYFTVRISPELSERLERQARRRNTSINSVIRHALMKTFLPEAFDPPSKKREREPKPLPTFRPRAEQSPQRQAETRAMIRRVFGVPEPTPVSAPIDF